jgi:DNA polymerase-3 subunit delta'
MPRFVLINNVEKLNLNSSNALLKVIEEPNDDIFFILIHNDRKKILPTLKSRCLTFKISLSFKKTIEITNYLLKNDIFSMINPDLINFYYSPGDFINIMNFANEKKIDLTEYNITKFLHFLIDNSYYKKNKYVKDLIFDYIELYFLKIYKLSTSKKLILNTYHAFINKVDNANRFNLDDESLFIEFKSSVLNA